MKYTRNGIVFVNDGSEYIDVINSSGEAFDCIHFEGTGRNEFRQLCNDWLADDYQDWAGNGYC